MPALPTDSRQPSGPHEWYVLVHQLPPTPLYLRAKIRNRLARVGAVALKNSVYVLPAREDCLEDFQWIVQEAVAGGGEAYVCQGQFLVGVSTADLVQRFKRAADARYAPLGAELTAVLGRRRTGAKRGGLRKDEPVALSSLRKQFDEIRATDFFDAGVGKEIAVMIRALEHPRSAGPSKTTPGRFRDLVGRTWVTRRNPKVDRLSSAWLIRRFVDPAARFRFIDAARDAKRAGELTFDLVGGDFTHEEDRCTFETLDKRLGITDAAVRQIGEIVHDLDLKDGKFGRPEAAGVQQIIAGLVRGYSNDDERLARGLALFEDLYVAFGGTTAKPMRKTSRSRPRVRSKPSS